MLGLTVHAAKTSRTATAVRSVHPRPAVPPILRHRPATTAPVPWPRASAATHYFDACAQSALTLRTLMDAARQPDAPLGTSGEQLMMHAVSTLVSATCPQGDMDSESHAYFSLLLKMHLSSLRPEELRSLAATLKKVGYDAVSAAAARQHDVYDASGFVSDKPEDMASLPPDWHQLLEEAVEQAAATARRPLAGPPPSDAEARAARQCLLDAAVHWPTSGQSMPDLVTIAGQLSEAIGLSPAPRVGCSGKLTQRGSMFDWQNDTLVMDLQAFRALADDADGKFFVEVLRDLLELLVTRKMFGASAHPSRLCAIDRGRLSTAIQSVLQARPRMPETVLRQAAARVLATSAAMGKVQVLPTIGVALGHAAIGAALSVVPDLRQPALGIGTRYLHPGYLLAPDDCPVMQWPVRWLDANENASLFPDAHTWQVTVPVERERLAAAARDVADEWKAHDRPYRFIGSAPGMPSTGCRASVLAAIERGMDDDARSLFAYFNAGLPAPESPTELAARMDGFLRWLPTVAARGLQ